MGGGSPAQAIQSAPVPTPAPPVTADNQAVVAAELQAQQANALKKTIKGTILAGDTGIYHQGSGNPAGMATPNTTGFKGKLGG